MSFLLKTKTVISNSEDVLQKYGLTGEPAESYFTQYALVCLSAEMQETLYKIVEECNVTKKSHGAIGCFVKQTSGKVLRSVLKGEIAGFIGNFGNEFRQEFNDLLIDKETEISSYDSSIKNRHRVAHTTGVTTSFLDIKKSVTAAEYILTAFSAVLNKA